MLLKPYHFIYIGGFSFLIGILLGNQFGFSWLFFYTSSVLAVVLFLLLSEYTWGKVIVLIIFFLSLGMWRYFVAWPVIDYGHVAGYADDFVTIQGVVAQEADIRKNQQRLILKTESVDNQVVRGNLLVTLPLYPEYEYGDKLELKGRLQRPEAFEGFAYDKYLARYNIYALIYYPKVKFVSHIQGNIFYAAVLKIKQSLILRVNQLLPEPEASFLGGLLWGAKRSIPENLLASFNATGTTHIIALSGYNITILALIIFFICPWIGIKRQNAFWLVVGIVFLFVIFTGWPASVVRAAIMGILVLIAYRWGRISRIGILLVVSAVVMCLINPKVLVFDVGFQLSFLATIGLIYLAPRLEKYLYFLPKRFALQESMVSTISAIIMTAPLVLYQFDRFSLVALPANMLILFIIPLTMALGFLGVLASFVFYPLGQIIAWLAWLCLHYIVVLVDLLGKFSFAFLSVENFSFLGLIFLYLLIFIYIFYFHVKKIIIKI